MPQLIGDDQHHLMSSISFCSVRFSAQVSDRTKLVELSAHRHRLGCEGEVEAWQVVCGMLLVNFLQCELLQGFMNG
jgi:hypothetical protein